MNDKPWWKGSRGEWYVVAQFVLFGLIATAPLLTGNIPAWNTPWSITSLVVGLGLGLLGLVLAFAGLLHLGSNLTALPHPKPDSTMVESGAYSIVRHPIYSGLIFGAFGWMLIWGSLLALLKSFLNILATRAESAN